jgi:CRISPR-associated protein (TIGR02710 family)
MSLLLVSSLGGSVDPVVASVLAEKPAQLVLIVTQESRKLIDQRPGQDIQSKLATTDVASLLGSRLDDVLLDDAQDLQHCIEVIHRRLSGLVRKWAARSSTHRVMVDFTGGTKCMSAALCFVAQRWPCILRYVGGTQRTAGGIGVVVSGYEYFLESHNPWNSLGYQTAADAILLVNEGSPAAASALIDRAVPQITASHVKRALQTLRQLASALHSWDLFDHIRAITFLDSVQKNQNDLLYFWTEESCERTASEIAQVASYLRTLTTADESHRYRALSLDLLANAARRLHEERFDDAVARCYRAIEALAQARLAEAHGIVPTKRVPFERIPGPMAARLGPARPPDGSVMLALQQDFELLRGYDDAMGHRFYELGLGRETRTSPLQARNDSIIGHGDRPLNRETAERLFRAALALAEADVVNLPRFPQLSDV